MAVFSGLDPHGMIAFFYLPPHAAPMPRARGGIFYGLTP